MKTRLDNTERLHPLIRLAGVTIAAILIAAGCSRITGFAESKPPPELEHGKNFLSAGDKPSPLSYYLAAIASAPRDPDVYFAVMNNAARQNQREHAGRYYRQTEAAAQSLPKKL